MKLEFYTDYPDEVDLRPNEKSRAWMDDTGSQFAYRCLPLNIANSHGWSFHCTETFSLKWDADQAPDTMLFKSHDNDRLQKYVCSNIFGHGILTFHMNGVFRTPPGWNLFITGPFNYPKDGIQALGGVFEADWSPYSFTMNWQVTRPFTWITFEKGEPFCSIFPIPRGYLQDFEPEMSLLSDQGELSDMHRKWSDERVKFNEEIKVPGSEARAQKWQKSYFQNYMPDRETKGPDDHQTKLKLKPFKR